MRQELNVDFLLGEAGRWRAQIAKQFQKHSNGSLLGTEEYGEKTGPNHSRKRWGKKKSTFRTSYNEGNAGKGPKKQLQDLGRQTGNSKEEVNHEQNSHEAASWSEGSKVFQEGDTLEKPGAQRHRTTCVLT